MVEQIRGVVAVLMLAGGLAAWVTVESRRDEPCVCAESSTGTERAAVHPVGGDAAASGAAVEVSGGDEPGGDDAGSSVALLSSRRGAPCEK